MTTPYLFPLSQYTLHFLLQNEYGPRVFVPAYFFPRPYDYYRRVPTATSASSTVVGHVSDSIDPLDHQRDAVYSSSDNSGIYRILPQRDDNASVATTSIELGSLNTNIVDAAQSVETGNLRECSICFYGIELIHKAYMVSITFTSNDLIQYYFNYVNALWQVTPCDHLFHKDCLRRWMEVKLECPVCRAQLPAVDE